MKNIRGNSNILIALWRDFAFFDSLLYHTLELKKKANGKIYIFMPKKEKLLEKLAKYQIDRVFFLDNEECIYDASIFTDQVSKIILNKNCNLVLFNNTLNDREISSRLSIRLNIPVCYTCSLVDYGKRYEAWLPEKRFIQFWTLLVKGGSDPVVFFKAG